MRQFELIVAVLLPLVAPAMACAVPSATLTPAERACCKQMASQCGHMEMAAAHDCCQMEAPITAQWNVAQLPTTHASDSLNASADLPLDAGLQLPSRLPGEVWQHSLALPQSPPAVISILRI
ncbi:MAG: hypothetical protein ACRD3F_15525 [Acidobacteriaceae bacterium]